MTVDTPPRAELLRAASIAGWVRNPVATTPGDTFNRGRQRLTIIYNGIHYTAAISTAYYSEQRTQPADRSAHKLCKPTRQCLPPKSASGAIVERIVATRLLTLFNIVLGIINSDPPPAATQ